MSIQDENELDEFLSRFVALMDEFRSVRDAGVEISIPADAPLAQGSVLLTRVAREADASSVLRDDVNAPPGNEADASAVASGCNCPPGFRCVRLFPGGERVCIPRKG